MNNYALAINRAEAMADPTPATLAKYMGYPAPRHCKKWWKDANTAKYVLIQASRRHFKSRSFSIIYPVYRLLQNPNRQILLVGESLSTTSRWTREILQHVEDKNGILTHMIPESPAKWTSDEFIIARDSRSGEPSIRAVGVGGRMLGSGADDIICDDVISQENSHTLARRDNISDWFDNVLLPMVTKAGRVTVIGTPWHEDDQYARMKAAGNWKVIQYPAISGDYPGGIPFDEYSDEDKAKMIKYMKKEEKVRSFLRKYPGGPLWPEEYPIVRLVEMCSIMGSTAFAQQFGLDLSLAEGGLVQIEWLEWHGKIPDHAPLTWMIGVDPSIGRTELSDYTGIVVAAKDGQTGKYYVEDISYGRWEAMDRINAIRKMYERYPDSHIVIEESSMSMDFIDMIQRETQLPVKPISHKGRDKVSRLKSITPIIERGDISFSYRLKKSMLIDQLISFPEGSYDDLVDAFVYAIKAFGSGGFVGLSNIGSDRYGRRRL